MLTYEQAYESAKVYLGFNHEIFTLIRWCQLLPLASWKEWTDGHGHILSLELNKKVKFKTIVVEEPEITDLYFQAPPASLAKLGSQAILLLTSTRGYLYLLSQDETLRLLTCDTETWLPNLPVLSSGLTVLTAVVQGLMNSSLNFKNLSIDSQPVIHGWYMKYPEETMWSGELSQLNPQIYARIMEIL